MSSETYVICRDCGVILTTIDKDLDDKDGCTYLAVETGHDCCPILGDNDRTAIETEEEMVERGEHPLFRNPEFSEPEIDAMTERLKAYRKWTSEKTKEEPEPEKLLTATEVILRRKLNEEQTRRFVRSTGDTYGGKTNGTLS